jgi:hypothetical protein
MGVPAEFSFDPTSGRMLPVFVGDILGSDPFALKMLAKAVAEGAAILSIIDQAQLLAFLSVLAEGPFVVKSFLRPQSGQSGSGPGPDFYALVVDGTIMSLWRRCPRHRDLGPHPFNGRCPRCLAQASAAAREAAAKEKKGQGKKS